MKRDEVGRVIREKYLAEARERGTPLPAGRALADLLGVSRETVRRAVASLRERGEVTTRHGAGVFPAAGGATSAAVGGSTAPSNMFDLDEPDMPVIRCLVRDHRPNATLAQRFERRIARSVAQQRAQGSPVTDREAVQE